MEPYCNYPTLIKIQNPFGQVGKLEVCKSKRKKQVIVLLEKRQFSCSCTAFIKYNCIYLSRATNV